MVKTITKSKRIFQEQAIIEENAKEERRRKFAAQQLL